MSQRTASYTLAVLAIIGGLLACNFTGDADQPDDDLVPTEEGGGEPTATDSPLPPTETPSPPPTTTPSITPTTGPNFGSASVYAVSHLEGTRLMVTIQVPGGGFTTNYRGQVGPSSLPCEVRADIATDRLYCIGPEPYDNYTRRPATIQLYETGSTDPIWVMNFNIPPRATPTPTHTPTYTPTATSTFIFIPLTPFIPIPLTLSP